MNSYLKKIFDKKTNFKDKIVSIDNGIYTNKLFGISFLIPQEWHVVNTNVFEKFQNDQIYQGLFEDFKNEIFKEIGFPSCVITKYDPSSDEIEDIVSPTINFSIEAKEPNYKNTSLTEYAELIADKGDFDYYMLKRFRITNRGSLKKLHGKNIIKYKTEYLFEHPELKESVMVEMDVVNIELEDFFLDFSMTDCKVQNQLAQNEFADFIKSIKFYD